MTIPPILWKAPNRELWLQILSIFLPGFVLAAEISLLFRPDLVAKSLSVTSVSVVASSLLLIAVLATSYTLGLVSRTVGFTLAGRLRGTRLMQHLLRRVPSDSLAVAREQFTVEGIMAAVRGTPFFEAGDRGGDVMDVQRLLPGDFAYTKAWLRLHVPSLSVDRIEIDINVRLALVAPVALAGPTMVRNRSVLLPAWSIEWLAVADVVLVLALLGLAAFLLWSGIRAQRIERYDSVLSYIVAYHVLRSPAPAADHRAPPVDDEETDDN